MSASKIRTGVVFIELQNNKETKILYEGENIVGRNANNSNITIKDKSISEAHGKIICEKGALKIIDTNSKNGIFLHNLDNLIAPNIEIEITPKDVVYFAEIKCTFTMDPIETTKEAKEITTKTFEPILKPKKSENEQSIKDEKKEEARPKRELKTSANLSNEDSLKMESRAKSENSNKEIQKEFKDAKIAKKQSAPKIGKIKKEEKEEQIEDEEETKEQERITEKKSKREGSCLEKNEKKQRLEKLGNLSVVSSNLEKENEEEKKNEEEKGFNKSKVSKTDKEKKSLTSQEKEEIKHIMKNERSESQETKAKGKAKPRINQKQNEPSIQSRKRMFGLEEIPSACFHPRRCMIEKRILMSAYNLSFIPSTKIIIVPNWRDSFDLLVMERYIRTFKLLYAICLGIPAVSSNWIMNSEYKRAIVPIDQFLLQAPAPEKDLITKSVKISQSGKKVFDKLKFYILETDKEFHLPFDEIEALIDAGGGTVIKKIEKKTSSENSQTVVITKLEPSQEDFKSIKKLNYIDKFYTIELVLASCLTQKIDWEQNKVLIN